MSSYTSVGPDGVTEVTGEHEMRALVENLVGLYTRPFFIGNSVAVLLRLSHELFGTPNVKLSAKQKWLVGSALFRLAQLPRKFEPATGAKLAQRDAESKMRGQVLVDFFKGLGKTQ